MLPIENILKERGYSNQTVLGIFPPGFMSDLLGLHIL